MRRLTIFMNAMCTVLKSRSGGIFMRNLVAICASGSCRHDPTDAINQSPAARTAASRD
jgi:hypothetical protein